MKVKDYMIQVGTTTEGKIIEVPDVIVYGLIFSIACFLTYLFFFKK